MVVVGCGADLSVYGRSQSINHNEHAPNWVAERLGASSWRPRQWRGSNPDPVPVHGAYQQHTSPKLHTGTSITLSMNCNCGNSMVRRTEWTMGTHLCATTKKKNCTTCAIGKSITVSSNWGISWSKNILDRETQPLRHDRETRTNSKPGASTTCTGATGESQRSAEQQDHGNRPPHHNRKDRRPARNCNCGKSAVFCTATRNIPSGPYRP